MVPGLSRAGVLNDFGWARFLSNGCVPADETWRVLFENVNVEGMRGRRRSGVDALGILHFVSGVYAPSQMLNVRARIKDRMDSQCFYL